MKIIATCGHPHSGYDFVGNLLKSAGVNSAELSKSEALSVEDIHHRIYKMYDLNQDNFIKSNPELGSICQEFAKDLLMANLNHHQWGWSDSKTVGLLEFWKDFDPQTRFILVYSSPEFAIAYMMQQQIKMPSNLGAIISSWVSYNEELLSFYNRNRERCVLVNIGTVFADVGGFINGLNEKLDFTLNKSNLDNSNLLSLKPSNVAEQLASDLIDEVKSINFSKDKNSDEGILELGEGYTDLIKMDEEKDISLLFRNAEQLFQEMESSSELSSILVPINNGKPEKKLAAFREYADLLSKLGSLEKEKESLESRLPLLEDKSKELKIFETKTLKLTKQSQELKDENELLLLQLHQVQEELEHYFLSSQDLSMKQKELEEKLDKKGEVPPYELSGINIDLRKDSFEGGNWYYPEADGRWSGPGLESSLLLPQLAVGKYEMLLDIVDAMQPSILQGLKMSLDDKPLEISFSKKGTAFSRLIKKYSMYPTKAKAYIDVKKESTKSSMLKLHFPEVVSPSEKGVDKKDLRKLGVRVKKVRINAVA